MTPGSSWLTLNPKEIAERLFWGAFINNGQTCAALKRLYVPDEIDDEVCDALVDYARNVPVGHGLDDSSILGPIQNKMQYDKVVDLVEDAKRNGARILCGGEAPAGRRVLLSGNDHRGRDRWHAHRR